MRYTTITVIAYAGHRGEERPQAFMLHGERIEVTEVLGAWVEEGEDRVRFRCFKVRGTDGHVHLLCHDEAGGRWCLRT